MFPPLLAPPAFLRSEVLGVIRTLPAPSLLHFIHFRQVDRAQDLYLFLCLFLPPSLISFGKMNPVCAVTPRQSIFTLVIPED